LGSIVRLCLKGKKRKKRKARRKGGRKEGRKEGKKDTLSTARY
jgi:hypothetical protein